MDPDVRFFCCLGDKGSGIRHLQAVQAASGYEPTRSYRIGWQGKNRDTALDDVQPSRRALMARIGPKDSKAELVVRRTAHALGFRFRLHRKDLPGTPDLVFPAKRKIIFVHGCFWHRHEGCKGTTTPKTRVEYWKKKFDENLVRDIRQLNALTDLGWEVLTIWECETRDPKQLRERLDLFLRDRPIDGEDR